MRVKVPIESQLPVKGGRAELALEDLLPFALLCFKTFTLNTFLSVCVASHVVHYDLICLCHYLKLGESYLLSQGYIMVGPSGLQ